MLRGRRLGSGRKRTDLHQRNDAGCALARFVASLGRETRLELVHAGERGDLQFLRKARLQCDLGQAYATNVGTASDGRARIQFFRMQTT